MMDRVVQYPHRYKAVSVAGQDNVFDFVPVPGVITEEGTVLNKALFDALVPIGIVAAWAGSIIPQCWHICDGTAGTPDLRDRFVLGAGITMSGTKGGESSVSFAHAHSVSGTTGSNSGQYYFSTDQSGAYGASNGHTHKFSGDTSEQQQTIEIMPPYYALAYIMRIS